MRNEVNYFKTKLKFVPLYFINCIVISKYLILFYSSIIIGMNVPTMNKKIRIYFNLMIQLIYKYEEKMYFLVICNIYIHGNNINKIVKYLKNLKMFLWKKTLATALGFEPRSFDCRSTAPTTELHRRPTSNYPQEDLLISPSGSSLKLSTSTPVDNLSNLR